MCNGPLWLALTLFLILPVACVLLWAVRRWGRRRTRHVQVRRRRRREGTTPRVVVVIPSYERLKYLPDAVRSVLQQTYTNVEVIVVNDGSTDPGYSSLDLGPRVRILHLGENRGQSAARNYALDHLPDGTEYVAFLDDDDFFLPEKIAEQVRRMEVPGAPRMSFTEGLIGDGPYNPRKRKRYRLYNRQVHRNALKATLGVDPLPDVITRDLLLRHNMVITSGVMVSTGLLLQGGGGGQPPPRFPEDVHFAEDWELWKRLTKDANILFIRTPLVYYSAAHGDGQLWG